MALDLVDVLAPEVLDLAGRLDALGERGQTEVPPELDERPDERLGFGEVEIALVNVRSILRQSTGNCWR